MKRTEQTRQYAQGATAVIVLIAIVGLLNWDFTSAIIKAYETFFKLIGYIIGPSLAYLGFIYGRLDKAEMQDLTEQRTKAIQSAKTAEDNAHNAQNAAVDAKQEAATAAALAADKVKLSLEAKAAADISQADADAKTARIAELEDDFRKLSDSSQLWKLGKSRLTWGFPKFEAWKHDAEGARIVTIGLFKGGVGKTHLASNFAAYVSEKQKKPVLLIDLDFQGSLSSLVLTAAAIDRKDEWGLASSRVDALFEETADFQTIEDRRVSLSELGDRGVLNRTKGLAHAWLIPADYTLTTAESGLLIDRTVRNSSAIDERYRLAHVLLNPAVRRQYAMIIIDTPPRMTLGTVNALVASHAIVIPTMLDQVSGETVGPFLEQIKELKSDLLLDSLSIAAFLASMTEEKRELTLRETKHRNQILAAARRAMPSHDINFTQQHLPRKAPIRNSSDLGYFLNEHDGSYKDLFYDAIFDELWKRVHEIPLQTPNRVKLFNA